MGASFAQDVAVLLNNLEGVKTVLKQVVQALGCMF